MTHHPLPISDHRPVSHTPLHHWHARHGARFIERDGWLVAAAYAGVEQETAAARTGLALADVSAFAKVNLIGHGVAALTEDLTGTTAALRPRGVAALADGAPGLVCRLAEDHLLLLAPTVRCAALDARLAAAASGGAVLRSDATMARAGFCLVGPHLDEFCRRLTTLDVGPAVLPPGSCAETGLAEVLALLVRPPETSPPSLRVYVSWDLAEYVWEQLLKTGRGRGIVPLGLDGLRALGLAGP
jgi:glycine cleavage system aminomethyltransferase T